MLLNKYIKLFIYTLITLSSIIFSIFLIHYFDKISYRVFVVANQLGYYPDPYYNWLLGLFLFIVLTIFVSRFKNKEYLKLWLIKVFVTLIFMLLYEYKYGLDAYMYYGRAIYTDINMFDNSATSNVVVLTRFFSYFVGDSFYSLKLWYSFIGFTALIIFYKSYQYILKQNNIISANQKQFLYILFLFPTVLFWSSTLGKESLTLFLVSIFIYSFVKYIGEEQKRYLILLILMIGSIYFIRPWWSIILSVTVMLYYFKINKKSLVLLIALFPIVYFVGGKLLSTRGVTSFDQIFEKLHLISTQLAFGGSSIEINDISTFWGYVYYYIPNLFSSLFRPMFYDVNNAFMFLAFLENIVLLYLFIKYVVLRINIIFKDKYLRLLVIFLFAWSLLYVVASPTNLSVAVRFKLQILPSILILIFIVRSKVLLDKTKQLL